MNKRKFFGTILGILFWSACVVFFTFAYYEWKSTNTSVVIGISDLSTKCIPGTDVNVENIGPVLNYKDGVISEFSIENEISKEMAIDLRLDITSISDNLLVESFKYAVVTNNGAVDEDGKPVYDYTNHILEGDFENFKVGSNLITTALSIVPADTEPVTQHFGVIVYIDGNMKNDINMQNNSLDASLMIGNCEENATSMDELIYQAIYSSDDNSLTFIHNKPVSVGDTYNGKAVTAVYTEFESDTYKRVGSAPWSENDDSITTITFESEVSPISTAYWFASLTNVTTIDLERLDTSNVTNMSYMFYGCSSMTSLDLSGFDTSNVTNMLSIFYGCSSLTELDVSNFNTSKVTDMRYMFRECNSLKKLDLSNFNTDNVTDISVIFYGCSNLTELDISNFNTSKVKNMRYMFRECSSLISLDLSSFDTSNVTIMDNMFYGCNSLTELDLSNFNTSKVVNMENKFRNCSNLANLNISSFDTSNVTNMSYMFYNCKLVKTIITIKATSINYTNMFLYAANDKDVTGNYIGKVIINYIPDNPNTTDVNESTESLVDAMKVTGTGNIVKGCYGDNCPVV